ncbi:MipA/OmpV family protein [Catenovulum sp. 2E275]|uniref:MipA/OmpV family protein n=1 Tax=Catenovulum sp. 2E275 TaxID=2980497 RepID=UPI0021CF81C0|nr:MipA/OmpV family protein [Catenovulum sp. 2E275]MCU4674972.1 MipA/OmpV family protein [Catenovulum sp. 2E275]
MLKPASLIFSLGCLFTFNTALADSQAYPADSGSYAKVDSWHFSVSLGVGNKSNPLVQGDDFPLYILPSVYYYGENVFFENGDLGYTFVETPNYALSAISRLNEEVVHFVDWHPANILMTQFVNSDSKEPTLDTKLTAEWSNNNQNQISPQSAHLDYRQLAKRKWSLDAGVQLDWFINDTSAFRLSVLTDVSQVHYGENINLEFRQVVNYTNHWQLNWGIGTDWLSKELSRYYYGVSQRDNVDSVYYYQPDSALLPYIKLSPSYRFNSNWRLVGLFKYQHLPSEITDSPIVEKNNRTTWFVGVNYAF